MTGNRMSAVLRKIAHHTAIAALFLLPIFPLVVIPSLVVPFITGQAFYFRILVEIAFAAWLILAVLDAKYRPRFTPLTIAVSVFVVVTLFADLMGVDPLRSLWSNFDRMEGWITIIHVWALYMVMKSMFIPEDGKKLWHRWINLSLAVAFVVATYGLFQRFGWASMHFDTVRIDASFGHPTFLAAYLLFQVFFAAYMFFEVLGREDRSRFLVWAYSVAALLFAFDIFETGTRGTFLGLAFGAIVSLAVFSVWGARAQRKWRFICAGAIALAVVLGALFWLNRGNPLIQGNPILQRFASISWTASDQSRQYIWPTAIKGIMERPFLGWGQENFNYLSQKYYDPAMYDREQWTDRAHNVFLDQLATSGSVGLVAYLAIFTLLLMAVWRSPLEFRHKCIIVGLVFGYIMHNAFVFDTLASYLFFFATLALVDSSGWSKHPQWARNMTVSDKAIRFVLLPLIVVLTGSTIYYLNLRPFLANVYLSAANGSCSRSDADAGLFEKSLSFGTSMSSLDTLYALTPCTENILANPLASGKTKQAFIDLASAQIEADTADAPNDAYTYYISGRFLKLIGRFPKAESLLNTAHLLAPTEQVVSFELALVYIYEGDAARALPVLEQTHESSPGYGKAASAYAIALMMAGRETDARQVVGADHDLLDKVKAYVSSGQLSKATAAYQDVITPPVDINTLIQQARIQYASGNVAQAVAILRAIEAGRPQDKDQIEAAIREVQP